MCSSDLPFRSATSDNRRGRDESERGAESSLFSAVAATAAVVALRSGSGIFLSGILTSTGISEKAVAGAESNTGAARGVSNVGVPPARVSAGPAS